MNLKINAEKKSLEVGELTQGTIIYFFSFLLLFLLPTISEHLGIWAA
jgi:hypothetical protein